MEEQIKRAIEIMGLPNPLSTNYDEIISLHNAFGLTPAAYIHQGCACKKKPFNDPNAVYTRLTDYINNLPQ